MARLNVDLDPDLLATAVKLSGARSKREAIETAIREYVRRRRLAEMVEHAGAIPLAMSVEDLVHDRETE